MTCSMDQQWFITNKSVAFHRDLSMLPSELTRYSVSFDTLLFHGLHIDNVDWLFVFMQSCILRL